MDRIDGLIAKYRSTIGAPWSTNIAAPQRVIFLVYPPTEELRLRLRVEEIALATKEAGHGWYVEDLTDAFDTWLEEHEYREQYFEDPDSFMKDDMGDVSEFCEWLVERVSARAREHSTEDSVFALQGVGSLFGFAHVSRLLERTKGDVKGRYLVLFPGDLRGNNYRLLDARDGWNYLALGISADDD